MGFTTNNIVEIYKNMKTKGTECFGGLCITWDVEDLIAERIKEEELRQKMEIYQNPKTGRITMLNLGIL